MKNENSNNQCTATDGKPPVSGSSSFVCQGCKCEVPNDFSVKTDGYCYLCDPEVTLDECLQDEYPKSWR
jgi:hypothetical protein